MTATAAIPPGASLGPSGSHGSSIGSALEVDSMGPVDYLVVEFPHAGVMGDVLTRLVDLVDRRVVRVLDLVFLRKEPDGSVVGLEITDLDGYEKLDLLLLEGAASGLVGREDLDEAGAVIGPGSAAAIVVYENVWTIPFASALRRAGAQLVSGGRIGAGALLDPLDS